ncbi:MAG: flagellar motor protein MotB [Deltaproteobacteria bacterium]|nr:flagellar motor protein MotB [Deltaproteobacteria bacterium]
MEEEPRKKSPEGELPVAGWQTIYCSLALILVAFFAMLVSYSTLTEEKISIFKKGHEVIEMGDRPVGGEDMLMISADGPGGLDGTVVVAVRSLGRYLKDIGLGKFVHLEEIERGFKATFESHVLFPSGVAVINTEAYPSLDEMIKIAKNDMFSVRVEGHADNVPIHTPRFPSNWELSTTRAVNVLRYLLDKGNLPAEKLSAVGLGQYHPVESNDTPEARQKNRRVEFYFELPEGQSG